MNITKPEQEMITALRNKGYDVEIQNLTGYGSEIGELKKRLGELESRSGLMSKSFMTRIYTVWGYYLLANIWIGLVLVVLAAIFGILGN